MNEADVLGGFWLEIDWKCLFWPEGMNVSGKDANETRDIFLITQLLTTSESTPANKG